MNESSLERIKKKFDSLNSELYWGDDFDVRFYLISKLAEIQNKMVLDIGGGVGILTSELDASNFCVNLDVSLQDLHTSKNVFGNSINVINGSMTDLSVKENCFDFVICAHLLEIAKALDIENNNELKNNFFPTVDKVINEIHRVLKPDGVLLLTTPNNAYYQSVKLDYDELKFHLKNYFKTFDLSLYNTYPRLSKKNRKFNLANTIPKIISKTKKREKIINQTLIKKDNGRDKYSVSFFVKAQK